MNPRLVVLSTWVAGAIVGLFCVISRRPRPARAPVRVLRKGSAGAVGSAVTLAGLPAIEDDIVLWPDGAPGEVPGWPGPEARTHYVDHPSEYKGVIIWNVSRPTLTPYIVPGSPGAVVVAPGGGYADLVVSTEGYDVAKRLNGMGVSAFLLKYRVPVRPPVKGLPWNWAQLQDAQRAMGVVRGRAAEWKIDPHKIAFIGFSAGGHLSAHIATAWQKRLYKAVDKYDAVSCRPDESLLIYPWRLLFNNNPQAGRLSPEINVTAATPPAFIAGALDDPLAFPKGLRLYDKALRAAAVPSELHLYKTGEHGFAMCQTRVAKGDYCTWVRAAQRTLQKAGIAPNSSTSPLMHLQA